MASTIKDIAQRLNVSVSTVSYALNGGPRHVPERTRRRVLDMAAELQYRPNRLARSLVGRRSHVLGIVPTIFAPNVAVGPYFVAGLNGVFGAAEAAGHDVLIYTQHSSFDTEDGAQGLADGRSDGLIFLAPRLESPATAFIRKIEFPHVVIDGDEHEGSPTFKVDNVAGMEAAVGHLADLGHRRIAHIAGPSSLRDGVERLEGYRRAMASRGLAIEDRLIVEGGFNEREGREAAIALFDSPELPTAVVCGNDEVAYALVQVATERGIEVPCDLSVVGFDDSIFANLSTPRLTTVAQPTERIATEATEALVRIIEGSTEESSTLFAPQLVVRQSTTGPKKAQNS